MPGAAVLTSIFCSISSVRSAAIADHKLATVVTTENCVVIRRLLHQHDTAASYRLQEEVGCDVSRPLREICQGHSLV
jgi:hypothetical protein